nr:transporter [uncultured Cellulosilyticum sp.]
MKERLRFIVATMSSYMEILISVLLLVGIAVAGIDLLKNLSEMISVAFSETPASISIEQFLSSGLQLIIGVEFVKMIAKHTMGSTIEVLVYAIARKLVISHGGTADLLMGVIAIAILFFIKKYLRINKIETVTADTLKKEDLK